MTFRDDLEAFRERAEALERENQRLRGQLAELAATETPSRPAPRGGRLTLAAVVGAAAALALLGFARVPLALLAAVAATLIGLAVMVGVFGRLLLVAGPREVWVLCGQQRRLPSGEVVGYRLVQGRRALRLPFVETADRLDLGLRTVHFDLRAAVASGVAVQVRGQALVRIAGEEPHIHRAVVHFLGVPPEKIGETASQVLEAAIREAAARYSLAQPDPLRFQLAAAEAAEKGLHELGIEVASLNLELTPA